MDDGYEGLEGEAPEGPEEPKAGSDKDWQAEVERLKKENFKLREKARRSDLAAKFDPEIAELVPAQLPAEEWESYAERLQALRGSAPSTASESQQPTEATDAPRVEPTEAERAFTAVANTPRSGTTQPETLTARQIQELMQSDPARALAAAQAKYGRNA